jgi:hypothetical protein
MILSRRNFAGLLLSMLPLMAAEQDDRPLFEIRLQTDLSSVTSAPGTVVRGVVVSPAITRNQVYLPVGALVTGRVTRSSKVGLGFRNERAGLQILFSVAEYQDGRRFPIAASLIAVDNAREEVSQKGHIQGILAADSLPTYIFGVWHRVSPVLPHRALLGLTGASGMTWARIAPSPIGAAAFLGLRYALVPWPNPEIHVPAGAELRLRLDSIDGNAPTAVIAEDAPLDEALSARLESRVFQLTKTGGAAPGDVINVAFVATRAQIEAAFEKAGWQTADTLNRRSFMDAYRAFTTAQGYANAPVSELRYQGEAPVMVFQKSFNTIAKRHHIRIWPAEDSVNPTLWLAAASHDVGVDFDSSKLSFTHKIDERLDLERAKVINDLSYPGCLDAVSFLNRPAVASYADRTKKTDTDGRLAVAFLGECQFLPEGPLAKQSDPHLLYRLGQRTILETRNYLFRRNAYYMSYHFLAKTRLWSKLGLQSKPPATQPMSMSIRWNTSLTEDQVPELAELEIPSMVEERPLALLPQLD